MVGFRNLVGTGIAPVSKKKMLLKEKPKGEGQEGNFWQIVLRLNFFQKQKLTIN